MTSLGTKNQLERLRAASLRPTIARIAVLQVFEQSCGEALAAEEIFRRLVERGEQASLGTVYRVTRDLVAHGLLRPLSTFGRIRVYEMAPAAGATHYGATALWAINVASGKRVRLASGDDLHGLLLSAVIDSGLALEGGRVCVEFDCAAAAPCRAAEPAPRLYHLRPKQRVRTR